jgi:hypothetical protein
MEEAGLLKGDDDIGNDAPFRLDTLAGGVDLGHERLRPRNPIHRRLLSFSLEHGRSSTSFFPVYRSNLPLSALGQHLRAAAAMPAGARHGSRLTSRISRHAWRAEEEER